jgi:type II restriction/modification system DNA methylase subunit YeeA
LAIVVVTTLSELPPPVTPDQFITKWKATELKERSAAQSHFIDLCRLLDEPAPTDADPTGEWYAFERGATKTTGGEGWADVWKRDHFGWEYKGKRKDLKAAFAQLQQYALALENPPLLVVCDMDRFEVHTNWTNSISAVHEFSLDDLRDANVRQKLKWVFSDPERLKPGKTRQALTEEAAAEFAKLAQRLRDRGHEAETVAHFINRLVFCMFAEDVDLLPNKMFKRMLEHASTQPEEFQSLASDLFKTMKSGGRIGYEHVAWFNGGLFDDDSALPLQKEDVALTLVAAKLDWAEVDPSILGTLFERGLDPDKRSQLGAHYTDREKIMMIVGPVIVRPWLAEWEMAKEAIAVLVEKSQTAKSASARTKAHDQAIADYRSFLNRLRGFRVLDPACGSGNFLYLALLALKDIEHRVSIEAEVMGLQREFSQVGPASVKGIEINPYAAELARVSVWIGEIQWMRRNGFGVSDRPILKPLDTIECRDAILNRDGTEATWPDAHVIIGNPPFLGDRLMIGSLGETYVTALRATYRDRIPGRSDLVCYWFAKSTTQLIAGKTERVGLVATNSISGGNNLPTMDLVAKSSVIFDAWTDEPWVVEGADVRVAIVCFSKRVDVPQQMKLDGLPVTVIQPDLTSGIALEATARLTENGGISFIGDQKNGPFDILGELARQLLTAGKNPNGSSNLDVVRPWTNGSGLVRRDEDRWIIDFGPNMPEGEAALYEAPFQYVLMHVKPTRINLRRDWHRTRWWLHGDPRPAMRKAIAKITRQIITPLVSKHRLFVWRSVHVLADSATVVIARDDDTTFGILQSRFHEIWSLKLCTWLGVGNDPRYTPSTTFETFPFPDSLTPDIPGAAYADNPRALAIAEAAKRLNEFRENWCNPSDLVRREPEIVPSLPERILPIDARAAAILKMRTLTNLYNERPAWLVNAHADLDAAVAAAYGWPADISEDDVLARLFELNQARASSTCDLLTAVAD